MKLTIQNETARLKTVVLGRPESIGAAPTLAETYDAKSYHAVENNIYPVEKDIIREMNAFEAVLKKHGVEILHPAPIEGCNQIFARDVAFVIEDKLVASNLIQDREAEQDAYHHVFEKIKWSNFINRPKTAHIEGGDVLVWNDFLFVGTCYSEDYRNFKTARTNKYAIELLKEYFPQKRIIDLNLKKNDREPYKGVLHLDCCFNLVGRDKCIIYKNGFVNERDYRLIVDIFGETNCFQVTDQEMFEMFPNVFSIAPDLVVSDEVFTRLNRHLTEEWGIKVEEISYREISKMGGLLRCSTMPLIRE